MNLELSLLHFGGVALAHLQQFFFQRVACIVDDAEKEIGEE